MQAKSPDLPENAAKSGEVKASGSRRLEIVMAIPLGDFPTTIAEVLEI